MGTHLTDERTASVSIPPSPPPEDDSGPAPHPTLTRRVRAADASPWNWLLLLPIVLCLVTPIFNRSTPKFLGFPAFYWLQLLFVLVGVATTATVYQMTKRKGGE